MSKTKKGATLFSEVLFNIPRHDLVTDAAYRLLTTKAKKKVDKILDQTGFPFPKVGGWSDLVKSSNPPNDAETKAFLKDPRNKTHKPWHYVNLPLGSTGYAKSATDGFTRTDDIVQMIRTCVLELKSKTPKRFSHVIALRLVGHLVGDIHQPLHIGCGYIDNSTTPPTIVTSPATIKANKLKSDTGGNKILLPDSGNMHSFWDGSLSGPVASISLLSTSKAKKRAELVEMIYQGAKKMENGSSGTMGLASVTPVEDWSAKWANETLKVAKKAYKTLTIVKKQSNGFKVDWEGKDEYIKRCRPLVLKQMKTAARNLADLINEIYK